MRVLIAVVAAAAAVQLLQASTLVLASGNSDPNPYSFGTNPNGRYNKLYRPDSKSVLDDVESGQFSALYVKYHNCAWSANQAFFDDDGENRDGDENWYEGRASYYAANAAFSLYGTRKNSLRLGGCNRASYINSFFTDNGADVLIEALGLSGVETGSAYCQQYNNNQRDRELNSGDNQNGMYATMGCDADGKFATAVFVGQSCSGLYFANYTAQQDNTFQGYNSVLNRMGCRKIWNGNLKETSNGYKSTAHEVLQQSEVCDLDVYPDSCPDPWRRKSQMARNFALASSGRSPAFETLVKKPLLALATIGWVIGAALLVFAYYLRNRQRILRYQSKLERRRGSSGSTTTNGQQQQEPPPTGGDDGGAAAGGDTNGNASSTTIKAKALFICAYKDFSKKFLRGGNRERSSSSSGAALSGRGRSGGGGSRGGSLSRRNSGHSRKSKKKKKRKGHRTRDGSTSRSRSRVRSDPEGGGSLEGSLEEGGSYDEWTNPPSEPSVVLELT